MEKINNKFGIQVRDKVLDKVTNQIENHFMNQIVVKVGRQIDTLVWFQVVTEIKSNMNYGKD